MRLRDIPISAWIGIVGIALAFICALFAPLLAPHGESEIVAGVWEPMGDAYLLGTDNLGRDLLSRVIYGARTTLFVALAATVISFSLGIILSFTAAVSRGLIDMGLSRFNDLMMSIPTLIFALVVLAVLPQNLFVLILVMAILDSTRVYRLGRAVALDVAVMEFVEAARLRGEGRLWIIFRE
ncbi:MAG: ABC transporter permease, partial [Rhizobiales bacterium 63-7]